MKISRLKDSRGVSFMELLGILTVLGVMIAATSGIVLRVVRDQTRQQFYNQILNLGDSFRNSLSDNRAWRETVQKTDRSPVLKMWPTVPAAAELLLLTTRPAR